MAYEITYTPLENFTGVIGINSKNVSGSDLSVSLVGLQEYVNNSIQVRAYTSEGPGPYSNPVIQLTLEDSRFINKTFKGNLLQHFRSQMIQRRL